MIVEMLALSGKHDEALQHLARDVEPAHGQLRDFDVIGVAAMVRAFSASAVPRPAGDRPANDGLLRAIEVGNQALDLYPRSALLGIVVAKHVDPVLRVAAQLQADQRQRAKTALLATAKRLQSLQPPASQAIEQAVERLFDGRD